MKKLLFAFLVFIPLLLFAKSPKVNTFSYADGKFLLNGKPFVIKAAELHYARIPREYWDHRVKMCKALGMNTICAYVFWNYHEPREGQYDFEGQHDLSAFIDICKNNGMWVIVRPGPYVCAEWEMGGLPWWLLKNSDVNLRSLDPKFMESAVRFEKKIGEVLSSHRLENGGNIIMVQVENEYGSYAKDKPYVSAMRNSLRDAGWENTTLFQCDWSSNFEDNALPDLLWTMNFGTGAKVLDQFKRVKQLRPDMPLMCSEYWSGWFDGWGTAHQTRPYDAMVKGIGTMLDNGISFSLYMTHGGTSFGWWAGANNTGFAPDCTSYDYDAPINEQGAATEKYYKLRELLQNFSDVKLPAVPKAIPIISIPEFSVAEVGYLFNSQSEVIESYDAKPIEQYDMGYGSVLYTCSLPSAKAGSLLSINEMHDFALVYINGKHIGKLYRGTKFENTLRIPNDIKEGAQLAIYVYPFGRINYSKMINDPKGITENVLLMTESGGHEVTYSLKNWQVRLFPLCEGLKTSDMIFDRSMPIGLTNEQPKFYAASFDVKKIGDTYLDMSSWGQGLVWINGHCIGRFWNVGPQQTMYLPGCWLNKGKNEIVILDILGPEKASVKGVSKPCVDLLRRELLPKDGVHNAMRPKAITNVDNVGNDAAPGAK